MVQIDGSPFRWLGAGQPELTLVGTIDDASGEIPSLTLRPEEDLHGFTVALRDLITTHGVPGVLYGDRTSIAVRNDDGWTVADEFAGRQLPPHFGQMLEELGIRYIAATSPEAKGRIERLWRTLQDRLAAELALHGITTLEAAQAFLPDFIARFNRRFGRPPRQREAAWQRPPRHLDRILACRYTRTVNRDNTVSLYRQILHLPPGPHRRSYHRCQVEVRELLDGRLLVLHQGQVIAEQLPPAGPFTLIPRGTERARRENGALRASRIDDRPEVRVPSRPKKTRRGQLTNIRRPSTRHPWKQPFVLNLPRISVGTRG